MEAIFAQIANETIKFDAGDDVKWRKRYEPLYPEPAKDVQIISDERYGPGERNILDVYVPQNKAAHKPVLLFIHGGGFYSGDKVWSDKCYGNIGYCFAQRGIVVILANHQLVPKAKYPGGADDIQLIREWIYHNISKEKYGNGSVQKVILFGHSSGGAHICMNLFAAGDDQRPRKNPLWPPVAGVVLWDVPFWFDSKKPMRQKVLQSYWGSDKEEVWGPTSALGLFQRLPDDSPVLDSRKLPLYLGSVEYEVPETSDATMLFFNAYRSRSKPFGTLPAFHVLKKHNHLSNILSIGTEDTAQTDKIIEFMNHCLETRLTVKL
ncbi:Alpha/Beta hydrolase protein [Dactylonectria macrodidyma]|uniref:Alpha/Beta hydrolase protein n=1 Tax=Dactylonectria macrodidyma TaxID=307937 RepID=A0A9P9EIQ4_9HYPO|nr:Alpha/Beta hydrolase protein [Dactylonectria macrodidyma]